MTICGRFTGVILLAFLVGGCADESSSSTTESGRMIGGEDSAASTLDVMVVTTDAMLPSSADAAATPSDSDQSLPNPMDGGMTCGTLSVSAQSAIRPVDVVWVIDSSPSMRDEIERIQANLNDFASRIGHSGLDYKVILIGSDIDLNGGSDIPEFHDHIAICVPPPLSGSPGCPDTNSARYVHVRTGDVVVNGYIAADPVHSRDALTVLRNTFPSWRNELRDSARLHVIVVSDDDHRENLTQADLISLGLPDDFYLHSIVNPLDYVDGCAVFGEPNGVECGCGDDRGRTYLSITEATGGLELNLCQDDWSPIFQQLDEQVNVGEVIPCTFRIPEAPGIMIDFNRVNVDFVDGSGIRTPLVNVDDCSEDPSGWRYDNPVMPTSILLCQNSCGAQSGDVEVEFGCEIRKR